MGHPLALGQQNFVSKYEETGAGMHSMEIDFEVVAASDLLVSRPRCFVG